MLADESVSLFKLIKMWALASGSALFSPSLCHIPCVLCCLVLVGDSEGGIRHEAAHWVPADRPGGTGGVPEVDHLVPGEPVPLSPGRGAHHLPLLCQVSS